MSDDAARKMAEDSACACLQVQHELIHHDDGTRSERWLCATCRCEFARLRPLLAEREALLGACKELVAGVNKVQDWSGTRVGDALDIIEPLLWASGSTDFTSWLTKHATAGQPQSEGGEGSVAPGPALPVPPSPAVALSPHPTET